jgi:hypothetical protein
MFQDSKQHINKFFFLIAVCISSSYASSLPEPYASAEILPDYQFGYYANAKEIEELFSQHEIRVVIEVGSWIGGGSTRHMGEMLKSRSGKLYAIDTWLGSSTQQPGECHFQSILPMVYQQFLSNMIHWNLTEIVIPIRMKSLEAAKALHVSPDLIYIDAEHTTEAVYGDLTAWYPFVENQGILCGDDWGWESVRVAVQKFATEKNKKIYASGNFWYLHN